MGITRDDIINKVFTRAVLGYDENEVDSFLDDIMVDIENCQQRLADAQQENEKLKMSINRINEDASRVMASRQEINGLREENRKLQSEIERLKMQINEEARFGRNRAEADIEAQNILLDAKTKAEEILRDAEAQSREKFQSSENEANRILRTAKESANQIAQNVQEREKQIMDRAQERARQILEAAQNQVGGNSNPTRRSQSAVQENYASTENPQNASSDRGNLPTRQQNKRDDEWPGWLDR